MKIALLGYGKMGKAVEAIALQRGHSVGLHIDNDTDWQQQGDLLASCDVAIDFSLPSTVVGNIRRCFAAKVPVVVGTTGWYDHFETICNECRQAQGALFTATNFSIGMNIVFDLNRRLAQLINHAPGYKVTIEETHHIHKLDAPSGTAISLANDILEQSNEWQQWQLVDDFSQPLPPATVPVHAIRKGEVAGIHTICYDSPIDTITLSHSAKNRTGLALGAMLAAEFLQERTGCFTMQDLLA